MDIKELVENTKKFNRKYWEATLKQRLETGAGSCYPQFFSIRELEEAVLQAEWIETTHKLVNSPCRVYKANLRGLYGMKKISEIPDDCVLMLDDRKNTGSFSLITKFCKGDYVEETYLITGIENGKEVIYTFHPGEPIELKNIKCGIHNNGSIISKNEAIFLGFEYVKSIL